MIREYAEKLIMLLRKMLKDDEYFDAAKYTIKSNGDIEISFYIKQMPGFLYTTCIVTVTESSVVEEDAQEIVDEWHERVTPEAIKSYTSFIRDIRRWGTN